MNILFPEKPRANVNVVTSFAFSFISLFLLCGVLDDLEGDMERNS